MPSERKADIMNSGVVVDLSAQEIDALLAEAMAVDVLLQKERPGPYDVVLALSAYLSSTKSLLDADKKPSAR
jgi:hypothetical protein